MAQEDWDDLNLALELATMASRIALPLHARGVATERKSDGSALTEADLAVDAELTAQLAVRRPSDAILSEESGQHGDSARRWILDPIDGTSYFARHEPTWGTHVALEVDGEVTVCVVTRPVLGRWWWAVRGRGAYRSALGTREPATRLAVSDVADPARARVMVWARNDHPLVTELQRTQRWLHPTLDGPLDVAAGRLDAMMDTLGQHWDLAPAVLLIEEAGGRFTDPLGGRRADLRGGWFTNARLHDAMCARTGVTPSVTPH